MTGNTQAAVEAALSGHEGRTVRLVASRPTSGGCISPGTCIETADGGRYFMKRGNGVMPPDFFVEEARSLRALAATGAIRVPTVIAADHDWLLLEWLEPAPPGPRTWAELGQRLARMHANSADHFGWPTHNYIGSLPQNNTPLSDWPEFWLHMRLAPQWRLARDAGYFDENDDRRFDAVLARRGDELEAGNVDGASVLHGDLWNGNVHVTDDGDAALIDPSAYWGHREVDLAMAALFGGFERRFFDAYAESWPPQPEHNGVRRALYQLYYVLVHVNLFGGGYVAQARAIVEGSV